MEVIWAAWAVLKIFVWLVWAGLVAVWLMLTHIGMLAMVVGVLWVVLAIINKPISCDPNRAPSPWWGVLIGCVGAGVAYVQWNWT